MKSALLIILSVILIFGAIATQRWLGQQTKSAPLVQNEPSPQRQPEELQTRRSESVPQETDSSKRSAPTAADNIDHPSQDITSEAAPNQRTKVESPRPDPIEWIQKNWKGSLRTVTILHEIEIPLMIDGETVGSAYVNKNTKLPIHSIDDETITVVYMESLHKLPHSVTNIRELAERGINFSLTHTSQSNALNKEHEHVESETSPIEYSKNEGHFPEKFPLFSWDHVPVYKMFGDNSGLTDEQAQFIAATSDFVCFEKHHGSRTYQTVESGTKHDIAKLKKDNPNLKALMYFNASILWPNGSYVRALFDTEHIDSYYRAPLKKQFEAWTMKNKEGTPYTRGDNRFRQFFMNISHPEYQKWWVDSAVAGIQYTEADGIYIDAFWIPTFLMKHNNLSPEDSDRARQEILDALKLKLGPEKIIFINQGHAKGVLLDGGEGFMFENYKAEDYAPEAIIKDWEQMKLFHDAGKLSVWRIGVNNTGDTKDANASWEERSKELATFWTAAFLIGAQEYSYLQYGWGFQLKKGGSLVDYPEFKKRLGPPLGDYVQKDEFEFTRNFQFADVWVDLQNKKAQINWK